MACVWYVYGISLPEATLKRCKNMRNRCRIFCFFLHCGCFYAVEHPDAICIASVTGYQEQYLTGEWPTVITLKALKGKDTITIVVK